MEQWFYQLLGQGVHLICKQRKNVQLKKFFTRKIEIISIQFDCDYVQYVGGPHAIDMSLIHISESRVSVDVDAFS